MSDYDMEPIDMNNATSIDFEMPPRITEGEHEGTLVALKDVSGPSKKNPNSHERRFVAEFAVDWEDHDGMPQRTVLSQWMNLSDPNPSRRMMSAQDLARITSGEVVGGQIRFGEPISNLIGAMYKVIVKHNGDYDNIRRIEKL